MSEAGVPDFNALQNAIDSVAGEEIDYFVFDLPFHAGRDLRKLPLRARRALLREIVEAHPTDRVRLSQSFDAAPAQMLEAARQMGLEGIILKRGDAPYVSGRTESWLKLKCHARQELVVCGFTDRANAHGEVGSLLLGYHEGGELKYAGNVGTGWNAKTGRDLHARLAKLEVAEPLFDAESLKPGRWSRRTAGGERWVRARARRRGLVRRVDARRPCAPGGVPGTAPRQAGGVGDARGGRACLRPRRRCRARRLRRQRPAASR